MVRIIGKQLLFGTARLGLCGILAVLLGKTEVFGRNLLEDSLGEKIIVSEKMPGRIYESAVQAYIFSNEDILHLPVDSIPDLLRYAPGVHVQNADNGTWGFGIRGMNSRYMSRVSFTVDEQNIYAGLFSGLFGSQHDMLMEDIASVEVVYGPGGVLWGTNAMNGMVNVVMKSAFDTIGSLNKVQLGTNRSLLQSRYGWNLGESSAIRVYGKASYSGSRESLFGHDDERKTARAGWRYDNMISSVDLLSISGEFYGSKLGVAQRLPDPITGASNTLTGFEEQFGGNILGKWTREDASGVKASIQGWVGFSNYETNIYRADVKSFGLSGTLNYPLSDSSSFVTKAAFVGRQDDTEGFYLSNFKGKIDNSESSLSVQYNVELIPTVKVSLGGTYRYHTPIDDGYFLPVLSLVKAYPDEDRIWYSYSQGARTFPESLRRIDQFPWTITPLSPDQQVTIPTSWGNFTPQNNFLGLTFDDDLESEKVQSHQLGWEKKLNSSFKMDITVFKNEYEDVFASYLGEIDAELFLPSPYLSTQLVMANGLDGSSWGGEFNFEWILNSIVRVKLGYSYMESDWVDLDPPDGYSPIQVNEKSAVALSDYGPTHSGNVQLVLFPESDFYTVLGYRYAQNFVDPGIGKQETISQLDLRFVWNPNEKIRASFLVQNMLDNEVDEGSILYHNLSLSTLIETAVSLELTYQF